MKLFNLTYQERWANYIKYFLPVFMIFFCWIVIGNLIEINYDKENLNKITGKITNINEVITTKRKNSQDYELRIYLNNYPKYFRITDNFKYQNILNELKIGDEVLIYFRPKYLVPLGFGKQTDIYQLDFKKNVLFDLRNRKRNSKGLIIISLITILVFGTVYYLSKRKLNKKSYS